MSTSDSPPHPLRAKKEFRKPLAPLKRWHEARRPFFSFLTNGPSCQASLYFLSPPDCYEFPAPSPIRTFAFLPDPPLPRVGSVASPLNPTPPSNRGRIWEIRACWTTAPEATAPPWKKLFDALFIINVFGSDVCIHRCVSISSRMRGPLSACDGFSSASPRIAGCQKHRNVGSHRLFSGDLHNRAAAPRIRRHSCIQTQELFSGRTKRLPKPGEQISTHPNRAQFSSRQ